VLSGVRMSLKGAKFKPTDVNKWFHSWNADPISRHLGFFLASAFDQVDYLQMQKR
jgi:hypothetical protein